MTVKCPKCSSDNAETARFCSNCATKLDGTAPPEASFTRTIETRAGELARGALFAGRYEIIEELGAGGMGRVFRAHDTKLDEEVALKLIKPEIAAERRVVERFRNEIKVARKITHPNVGRLHDLGEEGRTLYLTMEYVPGEDLKSLIHRMKALTVGASLAVARQVAEGLAAAQKLGVVHRDLKPGNIMIDKNGNAKIMDFGIARVVQEKGMTGEGAVIGTPEYMSPEQVEGKETDPRSDIYALGVILFEMVTGRAPFEGETPFSIASKHRTEPPPVPRKLVPQIPEALNKLILRCLEKDRDKRYRTAEGLAAEIAAIEQSLPATDRFATPAKTRRSREITVKVAPRKLLWPGLALAAIVAVGLVILRVLPRKPGPAPPLSGQPVLVVLHFDNRSGDNKLDGWRNTLPELLIMTLQQSKYIRVVDAGETLTALRKLNLADAHEYSSEDIGKVASQTGATHVLQGSYIKAGASIIITSSLQKLGSNSSPTTLRLEAASEKDIIVKVDELVRSVKEGLDLTSGQMASDFEAYAGKITTSSPEALQYFIEGQNGIREFETQKAIRFLEKAIEIDPDFAMAYRSLATAHANLGHLAESRKYLRKALELSARLPENERLLVEGQVRLADEDFAGAIATFEKLVKTYPGHSLGQAALANSYRRIGDLDKAIQHQELAARIQKGTMLVTNLAYFYMLKGLYREAEDVCRSFLKESGGNVAVTIELVYSYLHQGKLDSALAEAEKLALSEPDLQDLVGDVLLIRDNLDGAEKAYRQELDKDRGAGRAGLYKLALIRGRFKDALDLKKRILDESKGNLVAEYSAERELALTLEKAGSFGEAEAVYGLYQKSSEESRKSADGSEVPYLPTPRKRDLFMKGRLQAEMAAFDEAQKTVGELESLIDKKTNGPQLRWPEYIQGLVAFGKRDYRKSAELFGQACSRVESEAGYPGYENRGTNIEFDHAMYFDALARALYESGELGKAGDQYERITRLTFGRLRHGDIYARAFYMLGKIAEGQDNKAGARQNYRKFLDLWKDADPGLPEVGDAKTRLAALEGR